MRFLLLILSFFFICELQGQPCLQHDKVTFTDPLQFVDCKSHRMYPVAAPKDQVRIVIVPHAQDEQAQCLMAATYRVLQGQAFDKIFLLSQADVVSFHGVALPCMIDTCLHLQESSIRKEFIEKLSQHRLFHYYQEPFCRNEAMQLQFTFLNFYLKNNALYIPIIIGHISHNDASEIAVVLAGCCSQHTLIVVSADIALHKNCMHDCPLDQSQVCKVYDQDVCRIQAIQSGSSESLVYLFDEARNASIFAVLFELLKLPDFKHVESDFIGYATSYDANKNKEDIQTYGAFIFQRNQCGYRNHIGSYEQLQLLQHARCGLHNLFEPIVCRLPCMISYEMSQPHGVFASLYTMSDHGIVLRGCMGKVQSKIPLRDMIYQMTRQAACYDLRFYPLQQRDLDSTIISLSIITDFKNIRQCDDIQELDGVVLQYDDKEAISLPTKIIVAGWDQQSLLVTLSQQIGLHDFIWKKPRAKLFTFRSLVFQEE